MTICPVFEAARGRLAGLVASAALLGLCLTTAAGAAQPNDPYFSSKGSWKQSFDDQWGLKAVGFAGGKDSAWRLRKGKSQPVVVAVVDSGLDYHHPDLDKASLWRNPGEAPNGLDDDGNGYVDDLIGWDFIDNDARPWDRIGHGTFVAGVIAAASGNDLGIAGINPDARIMPLRALNFLGHGSGTHIAAAIYYAVANGARIVNLSLGGHDISRVESDAIRYAAEQNVLVVVAGGNEGESTEGHGFAGLEDVITVGAVDPDNRRASFSNWGDEVDVVAPGVDILSLRARRTDMAHTAGLDGYEPGANFVGEGNMFYRASGTSFSAPFVTGVAALLLSDKPDLAAADVKRLILHSAMDVDVPGIDQYSGYGLLDAAAALQADPSFFIDAVIDGVSVVNVDGAPHVRVVGTAAADKLKEAWIEIGAGDAPEKWKKVASIGKGVEGGALGDIPAGELAQSKEWVIRLVVEHKNGRQRENRFILKLG